MKKLIISSLLLFMATQMLIAQFNAVYVETTNYPSPHLYIFNGAQYAVYDLKANQYKGANGLAKGYKGIPFSEIDATYVDTWSYPTPQQYIFSGSQYVRYDIKSGAFSGVVSIQNGYKGLPFGKIDAVYVETTNYPTPHLYFYSGSQYAVYDLKANKYKGVNSLTKGYAGIPFSKIDATYVDTWSYPSPQQYIFSGTKYVRYDLKSGAFSGVNSIQNEFKGTNNLANILQWDPVQARTNIPKVQPLDVRKSFNPIMDSHAQPKNHQAGVTGIEWIPCLYVNDPAWSFSRKLSESPWYYLERSVEYVIEEGNYINGASNIVPYEFKTTYTKGWTEAEQQSFSVTTSMESKAGGDTFGGSFTAKLEMTASIASSYSYTEQTTETTTTPVLPRTSSCLFTIIETYKIKRMDGTLVKKPWKRAVGKAVASFPH